MRFAPIVLGDVEPPQVASVAFPRTVAIMLVKHRAALMLHFWIPSQEWADRMADGEWSIPRRY